MKTTNHPPQLRRILLAVYPCGVLLATVTAASAAPASAPKPAAAPAPAAASATAPAASTVNALPTAESLKPVLPLAFDKFAPDFNATTISPPWLTVQVGTLETYFSPPLGKTSFVLDDATWSKRPDLIASYHPIEISCLMGAKARYDNVTMINLDKAGNPLGYTLPVGQILYFLVRGESESGMLYSVHYYDSGPDLHWISNPEKDGAFIPATPGSIRVTQDLGAPLENYTLLYLSQRVGEPRPDSTARTLTLYTYLVIHIHRNSPPAAPTGIVSGR